MPRIDTIHGADRLVQQLANPKKRVAVRAENRLRRAGHDVVGPLVELLSHSSRKISIRAEVRLIRIGGPAVEPLIRAGTEQNPQVRFRAAFALGKIGDRRAFDVLTRLLDDESEAVRYDAAIGLGLLGDIRAIPILERIALGGIRADALDSAALQALCRIDPERYAEKDDYGWPLVLGANPNG
jgi:HEAT repeat protein